MVWSCMNLIQWQIHVYKKEIILCDPNTFHINSQHMNEKHNIVAQWPLSAPRTAHTHVSSAATSSGQKTHY